MRNDYPHEDDWMEEAPLLSSLKGAVPRDEVPEGYFDKLPSNVMDRIRAMEAGQKEAPEQVSDPGEDKVLPHPATRRRISWRVLSVAASVVLLVGIGLYFFLPQRELSEEGFENQIQVQLTAVSDDEIVDEIDLADVSEDELFEMLGQEAQATLEDEMGGMGQEELLDYLDELELDVDDLEGMEFDDDIFNDINL